MTENVGAVHPQAGAASQLFEFLREVQRLRNPTPFAIREYEARGGFAISLSDLPVHPLLSLLQPDEATSATAPFLHVPRVADRPTPDLPKELVGLVGTHTDPEVAPKLLDLPQPEVAIDHDIVGATNQHHLRLMELFDDWTTSWNVWASQERIELPVRTLYRELFRAKDQAEQSAEDWELVLGVGRLGWPGAVPAVDRPVITLRLAGAIDDETGALTLAPADGAEPTVEIDMLDPSDVQDPEASRQLQQVLEEREAHLLHGASLEPAMRAFVHHALSNGQFVLGGERQPSDTATVSFAPLILLRRRSRSSMLRALDEVARQLRVAADLPDGILALVDPDLVTTPYEVVPEGDRGAIAFADDEAFLPLPVNDRQLRVIQRVDARPLTLVQGPPGTGKTHTAAALVSHLLAQGKRVLITAQTEQALREVRDKIPEATRDLVVSVIGTGAMEMAQLRRSVDLLAQAAEEFDPNDNHRRIVDARARIDELRREMASLRQRSLALREREVFEHQSPIGRGTLAALVTRWQLEDHPWAADVLPDAIALGRTPRNSELVDLLRLQRVLHNNPLVPEALVALPDPDVVPAPAVVAEQLAVLAKASAEAAGSSIAAHHPTFTSYSTATGEQRFELYSDLSALQMLLSSLRSRREPWVSSALDDLCSDRTASWAVRHTRVQELVREVQVAVAGAVRGEPFTVSGQPSVLYALAKDMRDFATSVGDIKVDAKGNPKLGLFAPARVKAAEELFTSMSVLGRPPTKVEPLEAAGHHLYALLRLEELDKSWTTAPGVSPSESTHQRLAWHADELHVLDQVMGVLPLIAKVRQSHADIGLTLPAMLGEVELSATMAAAIAAHYIVQLDTAVKEVESLEGLLSVHSATIGLKAALERRDADAYVAAFEHLVAVWAVRTQVEQRADLLETCAGVPQLLEAMAADPFDKAWDERLSTFEHAWAWRTFGSWLKVQESEDPTELADQLHKCTDELRSSVSLVAAQLGWGYAVTRLTRGVRADLQSYAHLVKKLGKGTGKLAGARRVDIQRALARCRDAVPIWVMPLSRIAETLPIQLNSFDVIIVDEASQAGLESLMLQFLAPKLVIVGDDKQVSPGSVAMDVTKLNDLAHQFLAGNRFRPNFADSTRSLFDEAKMRFGDVITLTEHRRCVPDIIGFSNEVAYEPDGVKLVPVREPGVSALEPVVPVLVTGGYVIGTTTNRVNPVEVDEVVRIVLACIADPAYVGKTIGVISLLGTAHAKVIDKRLRDEVASAEWSARQIRVGNAPDFQGSERDVMILTMVAAPSESDRFAPLVTHEYLQRFNVAASRAKDQMWIVHSMEPGTLNHPDDMRRRLLEYAYRVTGRRGAGIPGASIKMVSNELRVAPFDSLFEQRVHNELVEREFVVVPQYETMGYKIDLVVVGAQGKLAVECDGDFWHGPERFLHDLGRQRELERCGWKFVRILESDFLLDRSAALAPLLASLNDAKILPGVLLIQQPVGKPSVRPAERQARTPELTPLPMPKPLAMTAPSELIVASPVWSAPVVMAVPVPLPPPLAEGLADPPPPLVLAGPPLELLGPYTRWASGPMGPLRRTALWKEVDWLREIVNVEGPVQVRRLARLATDAYGGDARMDTEFRRTIASAVLTDRLEISKDWKEDSGLRSVHLPGTPAVAVRELGPRQVLEVPGAEICALIDLLGLGEMDVDEQVAGVVDVYDLGLPSAADVDYLRSCLGYGRKPPRVLLTVLKALQVPIDTTTSSERVTVTPLAPGVTLEEYVEWVPEYIGSLAGSTVRVLTQRLRKIVESEGPMQVGRVLRLATEASGGGNRHRVGLEAVLRKAVSEGLLSSAQGDDSSFDQLIVFIPGNQKVVVRELGPRLIAEVPNSEIFYLLDSLGMAAAPFDEQVQSLVQTWGVESIPASDADYLRTCLGYAAEGEPAETQVVLPSDFDDVGELDEVENGEEVAGLENAEDNFEPSVDDLDVVALATEFETSEAGYQLISDIDGSSPRDHASSPQSDAATWLDENIGSRNTVFRGGLNGLMRANWYQDHPDE